MESSNSQGNNNFAYKFSQPFGLYNAQLQKMQQPMMHGNDELANYQLMMQYQQQQIQIQQNQELIDSFKKLNTQDKQVTFPLQNNKNSQLNIPNENGFNAFSTLPKTYHQFQREDDYAFGNQNSQNKIFNSKQIEENKVQEIENQLQHTTHLQEKDQSKFYNLQKSENLNIPFNKPQQNNQHNQQIGNYQEVLKNLSLDTIKEMGLLSYEEFQQLINESDSDDSEEHKASPQDVPLQSKGDIQDVDSDDALSDNQYQIGISKQDQIIINSDISNKDQYKLQESQNIGKQNLDQQLIKEEIKEKEVPKVLLRQFTLRLPEYDVIMQFYKYYPTKADQTDENLIQFILRGGYVQAEKEITDPESLKRLQVTAQKYKISEKCAAMTLQAFGVSQELRQALHSLVSPFNFVVELKQENVIPQFPNSHLYKLGKRHDQFWTQDLLNLFCFENWQQAQKKKDTDLFQKFEQSKYFAMQTQNLQKLAREEQDEEKQMKIISILDQIEEMNKSLDMNSISQQFFDLCNQDQTVLNYCLDLHYQSVKDGLRIFQEFYIKTQAKIKEGQLSSNTHDQETFLIKIICGFGHHNKNKQFNQTNKLGLKYAFLEYFTKEMFNFAYLPEHGTFLVRLNIPQKKIE
eukprot:403375351